MHSVTFTVNTSADLFGETRTENDITEKTESTLTLIARDWGQGIAREGIAMWKTGRKTERVRCLTIEVTSPLPLDRVRAKAKAFAALLVELWQQPSVLYTIRPSEGGEAYMHSVT